MHRSAAALVVVLTTLLAACGDASRVAPSDLASPPAPPAPDAAPAARLALDVEIATTVDEVLMTARHPALTWDAIPDVTLALKTLYDAEPDRLLWFEDGAPIAQLEAALAAIANADDHGLDPADYDAQMLAAARPLAGGRDATGPERALFDVAVSVGAARMLRAVHLGRVDPATMLWGYDISAKPFDVAATLTKARSGAGLPAVLDEVQPPFPHYTRARDVLRVYRALAAAGEPPRVPELPRGQRKLEPGAAWAGVGPLAARLRAVGDLAADGGTTGEVYDDALVAAVKRFQRRHGLDVDGVVGAGTIAALNVSLADRVRQIELSMERMRWLPRLSDEPNVFVNVALFRLWATDPRTGEEPLRMNVVVGQSLDHRTPIFVEQMEYVIFRPYWNPPRSITVKEIVPRARRDPGYLDREAFEIVASGADNAPALPATPENLDKVVAGRLFIRQRPGPRNSLGLAKFIFPNDEDVYMHGTPATALFARARRDFSHGCIRLEDPARFAAWVLRDQTAWTRERIEAAMNGARPTRVDLTQPLTVVIFYATVHVNSEGQVLFVDDIYGHDRALDAALRQGYPYPVGRRGTT